ncbi:MAG: transglutaminase domain-containing protein [Candidatus Lokiarchaeota archaeon]
MSTINEDLLNGGINKKRVIAILLTVVILISAFAFSTYFLNFLFGTGRISPSNKLDGAPPETPELNVPPIPWSIDDLMNLFKNLNLSQDQLDELINMNDWNVDDLNLNNFAALAGALLFSDADVFRVSGYGNFSEIKDKLWRYECFNQYNGTTWTSSASMNNFDFTPESEINSLYGSGYQDKIITISMPLSPSIGSNAFVIPNLFPNPYILENSVTASNINPSNTILLKDDFNCTTLDLDFTTNNKVNMSYNLSWLAQPTESEINSSAVSQVTDPSPEYTDILNTFTHLPPNNETYVNGNEYFYQDFQNLKSIIKPTDNNFVKADKIRKYLVSNFAVGLDARQTDPPGKNEDTVYWFCEKREGIWSDFASAFAVFARAFGIPSRFVTGYNSWGIQEIPGENTFAVKYKNLYNWVEIYVPTDANGDGRWVQMDVFSGNIPPVNTTSDFKLQVESNKTIVNRPDSVNVTATLSSDTFSTANRLITFTDANKNITIANVETDSNGKASLTLNVNNSYTVGPHIIAASYSTAYNATSFVVNGNVTVNLNSVIPQTINISDSLPDETVISGNLYDPVSNKYISNAEVSFLLFPKGSNIPSLSALTPFTTTTNSSGQFSERVTLNSSVPAGDYEVRVDFNGIWWIYGYPVPFTFINASSNRMDLKVVEEATNILHFYINNFEANNYIQPRVHRGDTLILKAKVLDKTFNPIFNTTVEFYDYTNGLLLGTNRTNVAGVALLKSSVGNSLTAGPNLLYVKQNNNLNYSYYILDAPINITLNTSPTPREVNCTGSIGRLFTISGMLQDALNGNPIENGQVTIHMFNGGFDYAPSYLTYVSGNYITNSNGDFNLNFRVDSSTPLQNYTLEVWFNGSFIYTSPLPYAFSFPTYNNFSHSEVCKYQLKVLDPEDISITLKIGGNYTSPSYSDVNPPPTYKFGTFINIEVRINQSGSYAPSGSIVHLWDVYTNTELDSYTYDGSESGYHQFQVNTNNLHAGLHLFNITFETSKVWSTYNSSYVVINEPVNIYIDQNNMQFTRDSDNFVISGRVMESGISLRGLIVNLVMLNSSFDEVNSYLNLVGGSSIQINEDGTFQFSINSIDISCPKGEYYIRVDFNGSLYEPGILLTNYMVSNSSSLKSLTVSAGSNIILDSYYTKLGILPTKWIDTDTLYVIGNLTWDNGTALSGMYINVTVRYLNGTIIAYNDTVQTDNFGGFNVSLLIDGNWPTLRSETEIWINFNPSYNGLNYVTEDSYIINP